MRDLRHVQAAAFQDLADYLTDLELENKSPRTIYGYTREIAPLLRRHPQKRMGEFTPQDVKDELAAKPPRSRHITRSIYAGWFGWGMLNDRIDFDPMSKVRRIPQPERRPNNVFPPEDRLLLESLPSPDGELWTILFGCGLRRGSARRLQRLHVNLERQRVAILGDKGDKDRVVPFGVTVAAAIANLDLLERLEPEDHLWYRRRHPVGDRRRRNHPIGDTTFETWYRRGIEQAGVAYRNPHQTRHTYGHWLRQEGFGIEARQQLLGHDDIRTTQRYDHLDIEEIAEKMAAL